MRIKQAHTHIAAEAGPLGRGGNLLTRSLGGENNCLPNESFTGYRNSTQHAVATTTPGDWASDVPK